jgi:CheY-like chemotaxis protein
MSVSILVVDYETDVAELFRQQSRREARQRTYVLHFACSGKEALSKLAAGIEPRLRVICRTKYAGHARTGVAAPDQDAMA